MRTRSQVRKEEPVNPAVAAAASKKKTNGAVNGAEEHIDSQELLHALQAMLAGDFSVRIKGAQIGLAGKIADTFNEIAAGNQRIAQQLDRVGELVGRQGHTRHRVKFGLSSGAWGEMENSVNTLVDDLLWPTTAVTGAITAVAQGDLLQTVPLDVEAVSYTHLTLPTNREV